MILHGTPRYPSVSYRYKVASAPETRATGSTIRDSARALCDVLDLTGRSSRYRLGDPVNHGLGKTASPGCNMLRDLATLSFHAELVRYGCSGSGRASLLEITNFDSHRIISCFFLPEARVFARLGCIGEV